MAYVKFPYRYRDGANGKVEATAYFPAGDSSLPRATVPSNLTDDVRRLREASFDGNDQFVAHQVALPQVFDYLGYDVDRDISVSAERPPTGHDPRPFDDELDHCLHEFDADAIEVVDTAPAEDWDAHTFVLTMTWPTFVSGFERAARADSITGWRMPDIGVHPGDMADAVDEEQGPGP